MLQRNVVATVGLVGFATFAVAGGFFELEPAEASEVDQRLMTPGEPIEAGKIPDGGVKPPADCGMGIPRRDEAPYCLGDYQFCGPCCCNTWNSRCTGTTCVPKKSSKDY